MPVSFNAILPSPIDTQALQDAIDEGVGKFGAKVAKDFEKTVRTWRNKPTFEILTEVKGNTVTIIVGTDSEIYRYVNDGTRPHVIEPKNKKVLRFQSIYVAKTTPKVIGSQKGGASGDYIFAPSVNHPGIQGRDFVGEIKKLREPEFAADMQKAYNKGAKASGHAI